MATVHRRVAFFTQNDTGEATVHPNTGAAVEAILSGHPFVGVHLMAGDKAVNTIVPRRVGGLDRESVLQTLEHLANKVMMAPERKPSLSPIAPKREPLYGTRAILARSR